MTRTVHVVNGALLLLLFAGSLWVYPDLPAQIPHHFDLTGTADAYWETSLLRWLLVPLVATGTAGIVYGAVWMIGYLPPSSLNLPNQDEFDRLDRSAKQVVRDHIRTRLYWLVTPVFVIHISVQRGVYRVATTTADGLSTVEGGVMIVGVAGILGVLVSLYSSLQNGVQMFGDGP